MVSEYVQYLGVILMFYISCIMFTSHFIDQHLRIILCAVDHVLIITPAHFGVRRRHLRGALKMVTCWSIKGDTSVWICGLRKKRSNNHYRTRSTPLTNHIMWWHFVDEHGQTVILGFHLPTAMKASFLAPQEGTNSQNPILPHDMGRRSRESHFSRVAANAAVLLQFVLITQAWQFSEHVETTIFLETSPF